MRNRIRNWVYAAVIMAGMMLAPAVFARGHVSVGIGFNLPGLSIGWSDCRHCGYRGGHAGYGYGGYGYGYGGYGWAGNYAYPSYYGSTWYGPSYYASYAYGPSYYGYPAWRGPRHYYDDGYYYAPRRVVHKTVYRDTWRGDYGHRARYYDRDGYYRR